MVTSTSTSQTTPPPLETPASGSTPAPSAAQPPPIPTKTTRPKEILRHDISNEELDMIVRDKKDGLSEPLWAFFGITIGSASPTFRNISNSYFADKPVPLSGADLVEVLVFFCSLLAAICFAFILSKKGKSVEDLVDEIRSRKKT